MSERRFTLMDEPDWGQDPDFAAIAASASAFALRPRAERRIIQPERSQHGWLTVRRSKPPASGPCLQASYERGFRAGIASVVASIVVVALLCCAIAFLRSVKGW